MSEGRWQDGRCLICGAVTYGVSVGEAPAGVVTAEAVETSDYYVWCSNAGCVHAVGDAVGDMECPPWWATHRKSSGTAR